MKKYVETDNGTTRINLPEPVWEGRDEIGTGLWVETVYVSPKSGRVVIEVDSAWDDGHGARSGRSLREITDRSERQAYLRDYAPAYLQEKFSPAANL